jgi:uncharacterized protein
MSTANPLPHQHPSLESEQRAHEPSMEEILASIRRIIADDDALPLMRRPSLVSREAAPPETDRVSDVRAAAPRQAPAHPAAPIHLVPAQVSPLQEPAEGEISSRAAGNVGYTEPSDDAAPADERTSGDYELRASFAEASPQAEREPAAAAPEHGPGAPAPGEAEHTRLISPTADASVAASFQSLAASMFLRESDMLARTTREMLRPMLKQWLDDNLPIIVERLVRAEIERVARGGR